ncbi:MAG: hypothetical protein AAF502_16635 [Bacteroidota bacterium]
MAFGVGTFKKFYDFKPDFPDDLTEKHWKKIRPAFVRKTGVGKCITSLKKAVDDYETRDNNLSNRIEDLKSIQKLAKKLKETIEDVNDRIDKASTPSKKTKKKVEDMHEVAEWYEEKYIGDMIKHFTKYQKAIKSIRSVRDMLGVKGFDDMLVTASNAAQDNELYEFLTDINNNRDEDELYDIYIKPYASKEINSDITNQVKKLYKNGSGTPLNQIDWDGKVYDMAARYLSNNSFSLLMVALSFGKTSAGSVIDELYESA